MLTKTLLALSLIAGLSDNAFAQAQRDSDKLDIKKLEDKYWSAKDDDFSVVQNRAYSKAKRFFATLHYGIPINDPYSTGNMTGLSLGYHFSERWGVEVAYLDAAYRDNDATTQFQEDHATYPNHNKLENQKYVQLNYIPLYAKMSFVDKKIIYFDMGLGLILGQSSFTQNVESGNRNASASMYGFSIYQHYFISEHFAIKADFRNTWTPEERFRYKLPGGTPESERSLGTKSINDTQLMLGLTFFL
ncbi:MAG: outer membrane beta-barrel domain-containing protein [Bdellovibrionaceae bacterium]|nr:outer membrane beta-barrel domain-containing protein [Pseudobdellovibrionaceae bacterium]